MSATKSVTILLIEDDEGHAYLIEQNLRRAKITNKIVKIADGQQAEDFLFCRKKYFEKSLPSPLLVLLDLNLPGRDGHLILKDMKENESTRHIPVIILTTTDDSREVRECYRLGCSIFITKPLDYKPFAEGLHEMGFFMDIVRIPNGDD